MEWNTRVTHLFGCRYPILEGAFGKFGNWEFAAVVSEAGALGMITASASRTPAGLRADISKYRNATNKPFAVNLRVLDPHVDQQLQVCLEEKVPVVETAGYKPDALAQRIKDSGVKWIHKSARVKDAIHAERIGVDAVIVVGLEGAGYKSPEQLPTLITTTWAKREIKVPFIAAGGIGDARGFLGALGMGADGVMMGTAFMATRECPTSDKVKEVLVQGRADDPVHGQAALAVPAPAAYAAVMKLRGTIPMDEWLQRLDSVSHQRFPLKGSLAVQFIDSVPTVQEFIDGIVGGAERFLESWEFLRTR